MYFIGSYASSFHRKVTYIQTKMAENIPIIPVGSSSIGTIEASAVHISLYTVAASKML